VNTLLSVYLDINLVFNNGKYYCKEPFSLFPCSPEEQNSTTENLKESHPTILAKT
jgi:hypothetical protein